MKFKFYCKNCGSRNVYPEGNADNTKGDVKICCSDCFKYSTWKKESQNEL